MWTSTTMGLGQSLILSVMGMVVVMGVLAVLAIAIIVMSKVVGGVGSKKPAAPAKKAAPAKAAAPAAPVEPPIDEEAYAVLIAAASDACGLPVKAFQITSIKEIG